MFALFLSEIFFVRSFSYGFWLWMFIASSRAGLFMLYYRAARPAGPDIVGTFLVVVDLGRLIWITLFSGDTYATVTSCVAIYLSVAALAFVSFFFKGIAIETRRRSVKFIIVSCIITFCVAKYTNPQSSPANLLTANPVVVKIIGEKNAILVSQMLESLLGTISKLVTDVLTPHEPPLEDSISQNEVPISNQDPNLIHAADKADLDIKLPTAPIFKPPKFAISFSLSVPEWILPWFPHWIKLLIITYFCGLILGGFIHGVKQKDF